MDQILKKLLGNELFNDETRKQISEAFTTLLDEAKVEQEKAIRAELAERYENDKKAIHKALETFLDQELAEHITEFRNGVESVNEMKKKYADKIVSVQENAKSYVKNRLTAVEQVIEAKISEELTELHESEKVNRRAYLKAITEAKAKSAQDREAFKSKAAAVLENIVNVQIQGALDELREDIKKAREIDFSRELFETFYTTFRRQFFNSSKEFKALVEDANASKAETARIKKIAENEVRKARKTANEAQAARKKIEESVHRSRTMAKLLEGLSGGKRQKMRVMLEATKTEDLKKTFKRFLPEILSEEKNTRTPKKRKLEETIVELKTGGTGNKKPITEEKDEFEDEILEIKRLGGVTKQD